MEKLVATLEPVFSLPSWKVTLHFAYAPEGHETEHGATMSSRFGVPGSWARAWWADNSEGRLQGLNANGRALFEMWERDLAASDG